MTISIPPLPPETVPAGASPAGADPGLSAPADGFDQFMSAEAGVPVGEAVESDVVAPEAAATEQAAVLAAALLWSPLPLLVETPPLAPELNLETGAIVPDTALGCDEDFPNPAPSAEAPSAELAVAEKSDVGRALCPTSGDKMAGVNPDLQERPVAQPSNESAAPKANLEAAAVAVMDPDTSVPTTLTVDRPASRRPLRSVAGREEKIAAAFNPQTRDLSQTSVAAPKTIVSATPQEVREGEGFVGTSVAKLGSEMPAPAAAQPFSVEAVAASPVSAAPAEPNGQLRQFDLSATEPAEQVRDTVATVMAVIDAQEKPESATHRTVNLDFNFGEERLAVRVELRDGTVHAHFRTQSLELRSALAQEWSQVAGAPENVLRLAEPVFVTSSRSEQSASFQADGGAARQQSQQQPQAQTPAHAFSSRPATAGFGSTPAAGQPEAPRLRHLSTSLHLQAVA